MVDKDRYYMRTTSKEVMPSVNEVTDQLDKPGLRYFYGKYGTPKAEALAKESREVGSALHSYIQADLLGQKSIIAATNIQQLQNCVTNYGSFKSQFRITPIKLEQLVFYRTKKTNNNYAGTLDFVGYLQNKTETVLALVDWKTGKGFYEAQELNAEAYYRAYIKMFPKAKKPKQLWVVRFSKEEIRFNPDKHIKKLKPSKERFKQFLNLTEMWYYRNQNKKENK